MSSLNSISLRQPTTQDGRAVWQLIQRCPPLDTNSMYCNLLQCSHFGATSVLAESGDEVMGFVSCYEVPERPDTLFIWQVAVAEEARGLGLGLRMLNDILGRPHTAKIRFLETSITKTNNASWALFEKLARIRGVSCTAAPWFDKDKHFGGQCESESLVKIGPFTQR